MKTFLPIAVALFSNASAAALGIAALKEIRHQFWLASKANAAAIQVRRLSAASEIRPRTPTAFRNAGI
jgi:hypothetical protein